MRAHPGFVRVACGILHDVNNLLAVIQGCTQLVLLNRDLCARDRENLQQAWDASLRAAELTARAMELGRGNARRRVPVNLSAAITGMLGILEQIAGRAIELAASLDPAVCLVNADPADIGRAVLNLVRNARDAMPQGGRITLATANVELGPHNHFGGTTLPAGRYAMLSAVDTGCGIPTAVLPRIFEPHFTTKSTGAGWGLATVREIVSDAGGEITVQSEPEKGTAFRIYLPAIAPVNA